jgi:diguanylate cyclase (GGDEF)-like protein/PAS domain S-box-containing protein
MALSVKIGICLKHESERRVVRAAAEQIGLAAVDLEFSPQLDLSSELASDPSSLEDALRKGRIEDWQLLIADDDQPGQELQSRVDAALGGGYAPWAIGVREPLRQSFEANGDLSPGFAASTDSTHSEGPGGPWTLRRPLDLITVAEQLRQAADACRVFSGRHGSLIEELHRFRSMFDSICNGIAITDARLPSRPLLYVNPAFERMTGYSAGEACGRNCKFLQGADTEQPEVARISQALREVRAERVLLRNYRKDGTLFWNELYISPIFDLAGALTHFVGIQNDVTERVETETQLAEERDRLHAAAESSMDCLYICKSVRNAAGEIEDFTFEYLNSNVAKMVSVPLDLLLGGRMSELTAFHMDLGLLKLLKRVVRTGEPLVHEFSVADKDAKGAWLRIQAVKLKDGIVITASDITLRKREEERTRHQAHHDPLTQLLNRSVLRERLEQALQWARRHNAMVGVFVIDLDGFKKINDTEGHAAGDETLIAVAGRLKNAVRKVDSVIRIGGDEFIVVMPKLRQKSDAQSRAEKILAILRQPIHIAGGIVTVTSSIGIALYPDSAETSEELLARADDAMYVAKKSGKNQAGFFAADREFAADPGVRVEGELHKALDGFKDLA